jgi:cell division initiation protein
MPLTPLDVENARFRTALRGLDRGDVDHFRLEVIASLEEYTELLARLKGRVRELEGELARFRDNEETLKNSMVLAQRTSDELIAAAKLRAEAIVEQARAEAQAVRRGLAEVQTQREQFEFAFHGLLSGFLHRLEQGNPALTGQAQRPAAAVLQGMQDNTPQHIPDPDLSIDMEDLTVEPAAEIERDPDGEETVIIPIVPPAPEPPRRPAPPMPGLPRHATELDGDNASFTAALDDAASRAQLVAQALSPVSGSIVQETAEDAWDPDAAFEVVDSPLQPVEPQEFDDRPGRRA